LTWLLLSLIFAQGLVYPQDKPLISHYVGLGTGSTGMATVTGSTWTNSSNLYVGDGGAGTLSVQNSGQRRHRDERRLRYSSNARVCFW
jgi:T5SS/PEP-CTERM-associated repeat protein